MINSNLNTLFMNTFLCQYNGVAHPASVRALQFMLQLISNIFDNILVYNFNMLI